MKKFIIAIFCAAAAAVSSAFAGNICGRVICGGKPVEGVAVSDGIAIVQTDAKGRYSISSEKAEGMVFITTPSGYVAQSQDGIRPGFWQPLYLAPEFDEIHDFALVPQNQDEYTVIFTEDMHLTGEPRRDDLRRFKEIVYPSICSHAAAAKGPAYTFNLGDFTHDIYWYQFGMSEAEGLRLLQDLGYPTLMYTIMGNHDHDGAIVGEDVDRRAAWMQRDCWGPGEYSVNIGGDHWIFLDNIEYVNVEGKGKKSPGIKGDRSYNHKFTDIQMAWLEKDLALVGSDTKVYICTHCPILRTGGSGIYMPKEQMDALQGMCSRFTDRVEVFSGHIHKFDICENEAYPAFFQWSLPATSGIMWETPVDWTLTSSDGCDSGLWIGEFAAGRKPSYRFDTYAYGEKYYRVYDMNEVGKVYAKDPGVKRQQELFPTTRADYSKAKWRNQMWINYWGAMPGDVVKMYENGKEIVVTHEPYEDPVKNFAYDLPKVLKAVAHHSNRPKDSCAHMYQGLCKTAKSPVVIKIFDKEGNLKFEETVSRPVVYNPSGK